MKELYYTPDVKDIRIDYEGEALLPSTDDRICDTWTYFKIDSEKISNYTPWQGDCTHIDDVLSKVTLGQIRTPYLTSKQIKLEECENIIDIDDYGAFKATKNKSGVIYELTWSSDLMLQIIDANIEYCIYYGNCPSINEFRTIVKLLNI